MGWGIEIGGDLVSILFRVLVLHALRVLCDSKHVTKLIPFIVFLVDL